MNGQREDKLHNFYVRILNSKFRLTSNIIFMPGPGSGPSSSTGSGPEPDPSSNSLNSEIVFAHVFYIIIISSPKSFN